MLAGLDLAQRVQFAEWLKQCVRALHAGLPPEASERAHRPKRPLEKNQDSPDISSSVAMPLRVEGGSMERPVTALRGCGSPARPSRPGSSGLDAAALKTSRSGRRSCPRRTRATRPTRRASMRRLLVLGTAVAMCSAVLLLAASATGQQTRTIYIGMDAPLTGPQAIVGQGDREAVNALVRFWNRGAAFKNRRIQVDILDNASIRRRPCRTSSVSSPIRSTSPSSARGMLPPPSRRRRWRQRGEYRSCRYRPRRRSSCRLAPTSTWPFRPRGCTRTAWLSTSRA